MEGIKQLTFRLVLTAVGTMIGSAFPGGYWSSMAHGYHRKRDEWLRWSIFEHLEYEETLNLHDLVNTVFGVGCGSGALIAYLATTYLGRRGAFLLNSLFYIIGAIFFKYCIPLEDGRVYYVATLFVGLGAGLAAVNLPMYLIEIAPLPIRGAFGVLGILGYTVGCWVGRKASSEEYYGETLTFSDGWLVAGYVVFVFVIPAYFYAESPTWLYNSKKEKEDVMEQFKRLRHSSDVEIEYAELVEENPEMKRRHIWNVLPDTNLVIPLIFILILNCATAPYAGHFIYIHVVYDYAFEQTPRNSLMEYSLKYEAYKIAMLFIALVVMTKINRRLVMIVSTAGCCFTLLAFTYFYQHISDVEQTIHYVLHAIMIAYFTFSGIGTAPIASFIGAELFKSYNRPAGMSMAILSYWIIYYVAHDYLHFFEGTLSKSLIIMPFGVINGLLCIFTYFYLPETRMVLATEVEPQMYGGLKKPVHGINRNAQPPPPPPPTATA